MKNVVKLFTAILIILPAGKIHAQQEDSFFELLQRKGIEATISLNKHDYQKYNRIINTEQTPLRSKAIKSANSEWRRELRIDEIDEKTGMVDFTIELNCIAGSAPQSSIAVNLNISDWNFDNYVLLPATAYNGNKFESRRLRYSPKLYEVQDIGKDKPIIVSDIPRLSETKDGVSRIQERSGALATPSVSFCSNTTKQGFILLTTYGNEYGDYGITVEESRDRKHAYFSVISPVVREEYVYMNCDNKVPSWDKPADFKKGDKLTFRFSLYLFDAPEIQSLFDKFAEVRKDINPGTIRNTIPYSACLSLQEKKFNRENFVSEYGYYSVGLRENFLQDWQIGWTGGMISTYPLLFGGSDETRQNVIRNFDWLFPDGISPSGFFWDAGEKGTVWIGGDIRKPHTKNWHLIRKSADAVYYIIKQFMLMEEMGIPVKEEWKTGTRTVCDSFVRLWEKEGQFGQFIDAYSGEICVGGSTSGAMAPAGLVLASAYFKNPVYMEVAKQSAQYYDDKYIINGISCGGPGDALQNPDSESAYAIIESFALLYDYTGEKKWLEAAERSAKQFATWVVTSDYKFPENSTFGKCGIASNGVVYANTQNKHGAPGICTASGIALLRLYRTTGNKFYIDLLHDIAHNMPQYLPHPKNPITTTNEGYVCERVNMTDWEGTDRIGEILGFSTWAETALMLTTVEIPGIYVIPDKGYWKTFDQMIVEKISENNKKLVLKITNPTELDCKVKILSENSKELSRPLKENALFKSRSVKLKSNEHKTLTFNKK